MSKAKANAKAPRVFVPLNKVDEEQRLVYGTITQEVIDQSGEMMDYAASKPNFEKWSNDIHQASGGLSKGNLRVMHGLQVAGKLTELEFNDEDKSIEVCSKIVDDGEWAKVLEGCYTGFSVGGKYGKRWNETVDGQQIKKFEAVPNEVSLVDNPCVKSATFSLVKADGAEEEVEFQLPDDVKEKLTKQDQADHGDEDPDRPVEDEDDQEKREETDAAQSENTPAEDEAAEAAAKPTPPVEKVAPTEYIPSNPEVAKKAEELQKAAGSGDWMDYLPQARAALIADHNATLAKAAAKDDEGEEGEKAPKGKKDPHKKPSQGKAKPAIGDKAEKAVTVTPPGVKQSWTTSDGQIFAKKADAIAHEESLTKVMTEAEKLAARLKKALDGDPEEGLEDEPELPLELDRLAKVFDALSTPFEDGAPKLEKGMYTVNRFSNVLSDMASLSRTIKNESIREKGDGDDATVSADLLGCVKSLGKSFIDYATDQVTELLAGLDDGVLVETYDYYYAAYKEDGENELAKNVCEVIETHREEAGERREEMIKGFGIVLGTNEETEEDDDLQKRFDALVAEKDDLAKVANQAIEGVEELKKRMKDLEDTPMPRAPGHIVATKEGDTNFLGKTVSSDDEKMEVLQDMLAKHGPDHLATMMIKASQASGGVRMGMRS